MSDIVDAMETVSTKKSTSELLDELEDEISKLEDRRKELLFEVAKEEVQEDQAGHEECYTAEEVQEAREEGDTETWDALREFGGHRPSCLEGALAGTQKLHRLRTCGWNEVATRLERA